MIDRFEGVHGREALVECLMQQRLVQGDLALAGRIADLGKLQAVPAGGAVMQQGGDDNEVYFIVVGRISMTVHGREVAVRGPNEHIGEMAAVLPTLPRSATGTALEPAVVLQLSAANFAELGDAFPRLWRHVARQLADRLYQRNALVRPAHESSRVFIICSAEALSIARAVENHFEHDKFFVKVWTEGVFTASGYPLGSKPNQKLDSATAC